MDLESTILTRYQGEALLQRLLWIATHYHDESSCRSSCERMAQHALKLAHDTARKQGNVRRYKDTFHLLQQQQQQQQSHPSASSAHETNTLQDHQQHEPTTTTMLLMMTFDPHWINEQTTHNRHSRDVLLQRLAAAQAHLNKEAIRVAYLALAEHDETTGELKDALHSVLRAKDYCTTRPQTAAVSLQILKLAVWLQSFKMVQEYTTKLSHTTAAAAAAATSAAGATTGTVATAPGWEEAVQYKLWVATGLERLMERDYKAAAQNFVKAVYATVHHQHHHHGSSAAPEEMPGAKGSSSSADTDTWMSWNVVLAPDDVALYAAFLSLAVQDDRNELVALAEHPEALELVPQAREALHLFARRACYQDAWKLLEESVFGVLQMDLYMSMHFAQIRQMIREKALLQYWRSYQRVELSVLAAQMGPGILPPDRMEDVLVELIQRPKGGFPPDTRLDLHAQTLVRLPGEATRLNASQRKLNNVSTQLLDDTYSMMIRLACIEHDLCVTDPNARKRRGRYFGGDSVAGGGSRGGGYVLMEEDDEDDDEGEPVQGESDDEDAKMVLDTQEEVEIDAMNPEDLY